MKKIESAALVAMDEFCAGYPVFIDLAYAKDDNLLFGERIYAPSARLWLHRELADIVCHAALLCHRRHGLVFILHDGLRTVDAQARMLETARVRDNPGWLAGPTPLLSSPGQGGHPRGMAIDISLGQEDGSLLNMGTAFDFLSPDPSPPHNPAHRDYRHLTDEARENRALLTDPLLEAAAHFKRELLPLPEEWWDFRFSKKYYNAFAPLSDSDLPLAMRLLE